MKLGKTSLALKSFGLSALMIMNISAVQAQSGSACGTASVVSGNSCENLKVNFDLKGCNDSDTGDVKVDCSAEPIKAHLTTSKAMYTAKLSKSESWGEAKFTVDGVVTKTELKHAPAKPVQVAEATPKAPKKVGKPVEAPVSEPVKVPQPEAAKEAASGVQLPGGVTVGGLADIYYSYNFNRPASATPGNALPTSQTGFRIYDAYHNAFGVNLAEITVKKTDTEVGFLLDLDFGQMADANAGGFGSVATPPADEVSKHIGQAIISYTPEWGNGLVIDIGKMATHVGFEVIKARDNWNYSRSTLFAYGIPLWHTGLHIGMPVVADHFTANLYVYNGWNSLYDNNDGKTLGAQFKFTPNESMALIYNLITGPELANDNGKWRTVNELIATLNATDNLGFGVDGIYGFEPDAVGGTKSAKWTAVNVSAKWKACPYYWVSPRFEWYRDVNGYSLGGFAATGGKETLYTYTLTNGFDLGHGLEFRLEGRYDRASTNKLFTTKDGFSKNQFTLTGAAILSF